jgi:hypothetical protein
MHVLPSRCHVSVPFDPASPLRKERMVRTVPRGRGSSLAAITADFCNNIGTLLPRANATACPQLAKADFVSSSHRLAWTLLGANLATAFEGRTEQAEVGGPEFDHVGAVGLGAEDRDGSCLRSSGPAYRALVRDASNVPVEPGNEPPPPGVVCVRGFARQPPIPDRAPS